MWHKFKCILIWRPLISIANEAYFHRFVSLSIKTPVIKVETIAECRLDNKDWHNQLHVILSLYSEDKLLSEKEITIDHIISDRRAEFAAGSPMHRVFPRDYIDGKYRAIAGLNGHNLDIIMFCEENCLFSPWPRALVRGVIDQLCPWHHTV